MSSHFWVEADQHDVLHHGLGLHLFACGVLLCGVFLLASPAAGRVLTTVVAEAQWVRPSRLLIDEDGDLVLSETDPCFQGVRGLLLQLVGGCLVLGRPAGLVMPPRRVPPPC